MSSENKVHFVRVRADLYKFLKEASKEEHRSINNMHQVLLADALQARANKKFQEKYGNTLEEFSPEGENL